MVGQADAKSGDLVASSEAFIFTRLAVSPVVACEFHNVAEEKLVL